MISRRGFIKSIGSSTLGVSFAICFPGCTSENPGTIEKSKEPVDLLSWVTIRPDNTCTITIPQTDIGQGVATTICQVIADELELDWSNINYEFYDPIINASRDNVYGWTTTLGSLSATYLYEPARQAAAQIRSMLLTTAVSRLGVSNEELKTSNSIVSHDASARSLSYAELAFEAAKLEPPGLEELVLKDADSRTFIGKSIAQIDFQNIVQGKKHYGIDFNMPGMRFAAIRQSPVYGAKLLSIDDSRIAQEKGNPSVHRVAGGVVGYNSPVPEGEDPDLWATQVRADDALAVVADNWWQAKTALDKLNVKWSDSEHATYSSKSHEEALRQRVQEKLTVVAESGDVDAALADSSQRISAVYRYPFMDPAPMEPMNCSAMVDGDEVHLWTNSQFADDAWRVAYELTGAAPENTHVHLLPAGGGFGRRLNNDFVHQAVQVAMQNPGTPVKLIASREESTKHSYYAPMTIASYEGGIDDNGEVIAWHCRTASGFSAEKSYGGTRLPFHIPNTRFEYDRDQGTPVPFGFMRGVGYSEQLWMNFSFLDELRLLSGKEPLSFYRELIDPTRLSRDSDVYEFSVNRFERYNRILDFATSQASWNDALPAGTGRGIAYSDSDYYDGYRSSTKIAIVDAHLDTSGQVVVNRVFIAIDAGTVINPSIVERQLEGGVAYALSGALFNEITVSEGQVEQSNFHDYPILRLNQMPKVQVEIIPSDKPPLSVGEDAVPITMAALVNAIVDAGGPRIRSLPIRSVS